MKVVYIGRDFYIKSGTYMSSVYELVDGQLFRIDWGFIEVALRDGREVHIMQANQEQMDWANKKLKNILDAHPEWR